LLRDSLIGVITNLEKVHFLIYDWKKNEILFNALAPNNSWVEGFFGDYVFFVEGSKRRISFFNPLKCLKQKEKEQLLIKSKETTDELGSEEAPELDKIELYRVKNYTPTILGDIKPINKKFAIFHEMSYHPDCLQVIKLTNFNAERVRFLDLKIKDHYHPYVLQEVFNMMTK